MSYLTFDERIEKQKEISQRKAIISKYSTVALFFGPYLFFFCLFFLYPLVQGIIDSFFFWNFGDTEKVFVGWQNYRNIIFANPDYPLAHEWFTTGLGHTCLFVIYTVPFLIIIPFILALLLNMKPWGEGFFRALFFLPNVLSVATVCLIFKYLFNTSMGFIKTLPFHADTTAAWIVIVLTTLWWTVGNNMVIMNAGLKQVDKGLYEAASIDGCSPFKQIFYITLPQIVNQILICTITTVIASFNVYGQSALITEGGPLSSTMMFIQRVLQFKNSPQSGTGGAGVANAMCVLFSLLIIFISMIQLYVSRDKTNSKRRIFKRKSRMKEEGVN